MRSEHIGAQGAACKCMNQIDAVRMEGGGGGTLEHARAQRGLRGDGWGEACMSMLIDHFVLGLTLWERRRGGERRKQGHE